MTEYIRFVLVRETDKTKVYDVVSIKHNVSLGEIRWYGAWRQYAFFPLSDTVWNYECLEKILDFLRVVTLHHRSKNQQHKPKSILDRIEDASTNVGDRIGDAIDKVL